MKTENWAMKNSTLNSEIRKSSLIKNSAWGVVSTLLQTTFLSLVFVIISRKYSTVDFANYLIAATVYQLILGISTMGLGTWFIREFGQTNEDKITFLKRYIKIQIALGFTFFFANIVLICLLYSEKEVRLLGIILGANIIFDNLIYALNSLNIAMEKQKKTAMIMAADAFFRLSAVSLLFIWPFSIVSLSILLVLTRFLTANLFIRLGTAINVTLYSVLKYRLSIIDVKKLVFKNWRFVMIVGISIFLWRSVPIIISKSLTLEDLANYEIGYKVFSLLIIVPGIVTATTFPRFVYLYNKKKLQTISEFYQYISLGFTLFSFIAYAFIISFSDSIIPLIFGDNYSHAASSLNQICLTVLVLPTVVLQANIILAMKFERLDMIFNFIILLIFYFSCQVGLYFLKELSAITHSIFIAFVSFHLIQNVFLIRMKINSWLNGILYYCLLALFVPIYRYGIRIVDAGLIFAIFSMSFILFFLLYSIRKRSSIHPIKVEN